MSENTSPTPNGKKFLHGLTPVGGAIGYLNYSVAGQVWTAYSYPSWDELSLTRDNVHLELKTAYTGTGFAWSWRYRLVEGVFAELHGRAETLEAAAQAALAVTPNALTFSYLGEETTWLEAGPSRWVAAIDGEKAEIFRNSEGKFYWGRQWAPAAPVLALCSATYEMGAEAPTLEEAMKACIDAPELFKRACAAMVMELKR